MPAGNGRFGASGAVARRQYCGKLHVIIPQEVLWKPATSPNDILSLSKYHWDVRGNFNGLQEPTFFWAN